MKIKHIAIILSLYFILQLLSGCHKKIMPPVEIIKPKMMEELISELPIVESEEKDITIVSIDNLDEPNIYYGYDIYTVGTWEYDRDCLWNIALKLYGNPYLYVMIYQANSELIQNPDLIYPGWELIIPIPIKDEETK